MKKITMTVNVSDIKHAIGVLALINSKGALSWRGQAVLARLGHAYIKAEKGRG